nr:putative insulin-like growth factor 2 antisense gene protein isoform X1 [Macaca fascicularis]
MRAESRAGAQRQRGPARRGAHREAGGCDRGRTRSSGGGRSNALWRAVDAAEEVPSPKEPPLMLGDTCLDFLSQDQHLGSSPRPAPSLLLPAPGENEHPLKDSDSPHGAWPIPQPQPVAAAHPLAHRPAGADLALAPLSGEGHACWRQPGWTGKSDGGPKLEASTPDSTDHPKAARPTQSQKSSPARTSVLWRLQEACSAHTCSGPWKHLEPTTELQIPAV